MAVFLITQTSKSIIFLELGTSLARSRTQTATVVANRGLAWVGVVNVNPRGLFQTASAAAGETPPYPLTPPLTW